MGDSKQAIVEELKQLWLSEGDLARLHELEERHLMLIRDEVAAHAKRTHEGMQQLYKTLATATRFVPTFLATKLAAALSPYVLAQVSEHMAPKTAANISKGLDTELLAEVVLHLSAEKAAEVSAHVDLVRIAEITARLHQGGFLRRLGEVSDALELGTLTGLARRIADPEQLAAVASHMQALDKLRGLARKLDRKMLDQVRKVLADNDDQRTLAVLASA